jgi:hypothetical protein
VVSYFQVFQPKYFMHFSFLPCKLHAPPISFSLISSPKYLAKRKIYEAPHYAVFSGLVPLPPSQVQIFSSSPSSQTPSIYVLFLVLEVKLQKPTKDLKQVIYQSTSRECITFPIEDRLRKDETQDLLFTVTLSLGLTERWRRE